MLRDRLMCRHAPPRDNHLLDFRKLIVAQSPAAPEYADGALYGLASASIWAEFIAVARASVSQSKRLLRIEHAGALFPGVTATSVRIELGAPVLFTEAARFQSWLDAGGGPVRRSQCSKPVVLSSPIRGPP